MILDNQQGIIITTPASSEKRQWQRFRGWTISILEELQNSGGMTVAQIAERVNHRRKDIKDYCYRLYCSGCIEPLEKWGWKITSAGIFLLSIQLNDSSATQQLHNRDRKATLRQLTLAPYTESNYSDPERAISSLIISHYNKTGSTFLFIEDKAQICELAQVTPDELDKALTHLYQDRICYTWWDKKFSKYQLRLYKSFIERMQHC
jgi:predicted transcriptional regulator